MEELFHPLEAYRDRLKEEHARNVAEAFEELVAEAGTDAVGNAKTCGELRKLREELAAAVESLKARGSEAQEELAATQRELREYETMMREIEARLQTLKRAK